MDSNPIFLGPSAIGEFYARVGEVVKQSVSSAIMKDASRPISAALG
jgi:hypothetical protein